MTDRKPSAAPRPEAGRLQQKQRVRTAKSRSGASTRWLERQLNDPFVAAAQRAGYRSRAAFKLLQIDQRFHLLKRGQKIVDLGAAPGGWSQIAADRVGPAGRVVAIDRLEFPALAGVEILHLDFLDESAPDRLKALLGGPADLVLSDLSPNTTGHAATDHLRILALVEAAALFAREVLRPGGGFVAKVFQGGAERQMLADLKRDFASVKHVKPPASRAESAEMYLVAEGYRPRPGSSAADDDLPQVD